MLSHFLRAVQKTQPAIVVSYITTAIDAINRTSYTFSSTSIGTAFTGRQVVVAVSNPGVGAGTTTNSVTIAGISATKVNRNGGATAETIAIFVAQVDTGNTADIVVTFDQSVSCCGIAIWTLENAVGFTVEAKPNAINNTSSASSISSTFSTVNSGNVIIVANRARGANSGTYSFTNATERYDQLVESGVSSQNGADVSFASNQTSYQITITTSGSSPQTSWTMTRFYL